MHIQINLYVHDQWQIKLIDKWRYFAIWTLPMYIYIVTRYLKYTDMFIEWLIDNLPIFWAIY